ncbi:MAG: hypothetical protein K2Y51_08970 [Gammaproteobacteria bacterium]|nr:hypothetical protein [Gammaproteobacteria bacterium]
MDANIVLRTATPRSPRTRNTASRAVAALSLLRRFAPAALVDRGIRQSFRPDAAQS